MGTRWVAPSMAEERGLLPETDFGVTYGLSPIRNGRLIYQFRDGNIHVGTIFYKLNEFNFSGNIIFDFSGAGTDIDFILAIFFKRNKFKLGVEFGIEEGGDEDFLLGGTVLYKFHQDYSIYGRIIYDDNVDDFTVGILKTLTRKISGGVFFDKRDGDNSIRAQVAAAF